MHIDQIYLIKRWCCSRDQIVSSRSRNGGYLIVIIRVNLFIVNVQHYRIGFMFGFFYPAFKELPDSHDHVPHKEEY